jgi:hypothetical protein
MLASPIGACHQRDKAEVGGAFPVSPTEFPKLLNEAFNHALNLLGVVDRNDLLCDMVARKIIKVGTTGISQPREIAEMAVVRIGLR